MRFAAKSLGKEPNESPLESIRFLAADKSAISSVGRTDVFFKTL